MPLRHAKLCAFGSTARYPDGVDKDPNLLGLLASGVPVITIFGKTWKAHSTKGLGISDEENRLLIQRSVAFLCNKGREVFFDAEHFFDGYRDNPEFALEMLMAATKGGATRLILCDTNGGSLPHEVSETVRVVLEKPVCQLAFTATTTATLQLQTLLPPSWQALLMYREQSMASESVAATPTSSAS